MSKEMENYLGSVVLPEYEPTHHRQEFRRELLDEMERRRQMAAQRKPLVIAGALIALVCVSVLAIAGVVFREYIFKGRNEDGAYLFTTKPTSNAASNAVAISSNDPNFTIDVEQTKKALEEIDLLRQQDQRELLKVIETEVEGEVNRVYIYKYVLADGREQTMGERNPDEAWSKEAGSVDLTKEVWALRKAGEGVLLSPKEEEVNGKTFTFERYRFTLKDGREVIHSVGTPSSTAKPAAPTVRRSTWGKVKDQVK